MRLSKGLALKRKIHLKRRSFCNCDTISLRLNGRIGFCLLFIFLIMQIADQLTPLNALSPLDGRYASRGNALRGLLSEAGFMAHRVEVEVAWLIALSKANLPELPAFSQAAQDRLQALVANFTEADAQRIKDIERVTNHDVK